MVMHAHMSDMEASKERRCGMTEGKENGRQRGKGKGRKKEGKEKAGRTAGRQGGKDKDDKGWVQRLTEGHNYYVKQASQ
jgi:hypothetical protein